MNVTLSIDEKTVREARRIARAEGKSLNQMVRDYLRHLTGADDVLRDIEEFVRLSHASKGDSRGWKFNREEIHDRSQSA